MKVDFTLPRIEDNGGRERLIRYVPVTLIGKKTLMNLDVRNFHRGTVIDPDPRAERGDRISPPRWKFNSRSWS